ncbi:MAG: hypothetical protein JWQ32_3241 [Marmoricola sp.]|nr:hypothetical protein [Marmoricola sp.]
MPDPLSPDVTSTVELLDRADTERAAGRGAEAARLYGEAALLAREAADLILWTRAALGAASVQIFGPEPGRLPALLYDVLVRTTDRADRCRLAAALARCWVYAGQAARGAGFADEAVAAARESGDPVLLADALDASLAAHWGPGDLDVRVRLAAELDEVAAHVVQPDARLQAHLWGLQVACEQLDVTGMNRQLRALELLGEESAKAMFFAASRRLMHDILLGRSDTATRLIAVATDAAQRAFVPDAWMVLQAMAAYAVVIAGDEPLAEQQAQECETLALAEGTIALYAEAAYLWIGAGRPDRAGALVAAFGGTALDELPQDVNWLLILQCVLEVALALDDRDLIETASRLLSPYADRAVINGGAVMFHGTTDDTLSRAWAVLGRDDEAAQARDRALHTYERIGAARWRDRLLRARRPAEAAVGSGSAHLHQEPGGLWRIGSQATAVPALRGFGYLRELVRRPRCEISALDLAGGGGPVVVESGLGELTDRRALAAYRERLRDLDDELAEAEAWADEGRATATRAERQALLDELGRAAGLGGRPRTTGSSEERARVAVKKAITAAIDRIATIDADLAAHLRSAVRTGLACSYEPDPAVRLTWVLD